MRLPISCTTSPTITSSDGHVVPSVVGSALGVSRMGNGYETAAGDSVRVWGTIQGGTAIEVVFDATADDGAAYIAIDFQTATANT